MLMSYVTPHVTLYHVTDDSSARAALKDGVGLQLPAYNAAIDKVNNYFNVPCDFRPDDLKHPSVGFYEFQKDALACAKIQYFSNGSYNSFIKRLVLRAALFIDKPYSELLDVVNTLTEGHTEPSIVTVRLPTKAVTGSISIGASLTEYLTEPVVDPKYIVGIARLGNSMLQK